MTSYSTDHAARALAEKLKAAEALTANKQFSAGIIAVTEYYSTVHNSDQLARDTHRFDLEARVSALAAMLRDVQSDFADLAVGLADIQAGITQLKADITQFKADIAEIKARAYRIEAAQRTDVRTAGDAAAP